MEDRKIISKNQRWSKFFIVIFWIFFGTILLLNIAKNIPVFLNQLFQTSEIQEKLRKTKKNLESIINLPEENLKIPSNALKFEIEINWKENVFNSEVAIKNNEIYYKIPFNIFQFKNFFETAGWNRVEISNQELREIKKLKEILEKEGVISNFKKIEKGYEFIIDKNKLKKGIYEWKEGLKSEETEKIFADLGEISGKLFFDEEKKIKNLIFETKEIKIKIGVKNLNQSLKKEDNLELFLISVIENVNLF